MGVVTVAPGLTHARKGHGATPARIRQLPLGGGPSVIQRLLNPMPQDALWGWVVTLGITAIAFGLRIWNLQYPHYILFDETYYVKDAYALLREGHEMEWPSNANDSVNAGHPDVYLHQPEYFVHPQLGKWFIAIGIKLFGMNSFGWRFSALIAGTLMVLLVIRLARRLSRSTLVGAIAGLLITFDGLAFVMSRIALLDIFQATLLVAGVLCVVNDRDYFRCQLAYDLQRKGYHDYGGGFGKIVLWRPWRVAAGVTFGAACGVKWNSMFVLAAMCVLSLLWDVSARKLAGGGMRSWNALLVDGIPAFGYQVVVAAITYVATWWSWFATKCGWKREYGLTNPDDPLVRIFGKDLGAWLAFHKEVYEFHTSDWMMKDITHPYEAHPAGWLLMVRPIGIDAVNDIPPGTQGCPAGGDTCLRVISGLGTPTLWWFAFAGLIAGLLWWGFGRDWRFCVPIVAAMGTYLPWFRYAERPLFFFYAITIIPFTVICLAMVLGKILGPAGDPPRRQAGAIVAGSALGIVILNFAWIYPILTDGLLPRWQWVLRMWLASWV